MIAIQAAFVWSKIFKDKENVIKDWYKNLTVKIKPYESKSNQETLQKSNKKGIK